MGRNPTVRIGVLAFMLGVSLILVVAGVFADSIRAYFIFTPRERRVEEVIAQVAEREKAVSASTGDFLPFSPADLERNQSLLGLPWSTFPVNDYFFDATKLDSGNVRLRALPRGDSVTALAIRARFYIAELSPEAKLVRSGWYPSVE
jgi:hypothetical protein